MGRIALNRSQLKLLAIVAMLVDHIAWAFVPLSTPLGQVMHIFGRLTGPMMAYFLAEGYLHTRNVKRYAVRLGIFALLSWVPFCYFETGRIPFSLPAGNTVGNGLGVSVMGGYWRLYLPFLDRTLTVRPLFGVIYTLFLALLALWLWDKGRCPMWCKALGVTGLCVLSFWGDWQVLGVLYPLCFFCFRGYTRLQWTGFCVLTFVFMFKLGSAFFGPLTNWLFQLGIFLVPLVLHFCYNGEPGSRHPAQKWFFYIFYPAHLLLLGLLVWGI